MQPFCISSSWVTTFLVLYLFSNIAFAHPRHYHPKRSISAPSFTVTPLGQATDTASPSLHRDGGGGGVLNNQNWIVFSDTVTENGFASNTFALSNPTTPTNLTDFPNPNKAPRLAVPFNPPESASSDYIWPSTSITTRLDSSTTGYAVYPVGSRCSANGCPKYNTLCELTTNSSSSGDGLTITRLIPQLFTVGEEPQFGTFSTTYSATNDTIYLLSPDARLAKVPFPSIGNKSAYTYWTGSSYSTNPLDSAQLRSATTNTPISSDPCGFSTGDLFYSTPLATWLIVYMTSCADSTFYLRYSTTGAIEGPYSEEETLYKTQPAGEGESGMNYAGHAYPRFLGDRGGGEVLLSWTEQPSGGYEMGMARVEFW